MMLSKSTLIVLAVIGNYIFVAPCAQADDLFQNNRWSSVATDTKASQIGDVVSVIVYQNTEARNSARNSVEKNTGINGDINTSGLNQFGRVSFGSNFSGRGELRRSESLTTRISVVISGIFPNGDFQISGQQTMMVNGENTTIKIRGRVRPQDITNKNQILSTKIADAEISYAGSGFVSKGAQPGIFHWLFSFLGLGF